MRPLIELFGADVGAAVPLVAVAPPIRVGDGTALPVRVMVAVIGGVTKVAVIGGGATGEGLSVEVAGGRVGVPVDVGTSEGVKDGKSKIEVGVIVAITICVGSLGGGKGFNE